MKQCPSGTDPGDVGHVPNGIHHIQAVGDDFDIFEIFHVVQHPVRRRPRIDENDVPVIYHTGSLSADVFFLLRKRNTSLLIGAHFLYRIGRSLVENDTAVDLGDRALFFQDSEISSECLYGNIELVQKFLIADRPFVPDEDLHLLQSVIFHIFIIKCYHNIINIYSLLKTD